MNIIFKKDDSKSFYILWEKFLTQNSIDFNYSTPLIEYYLSTSDSILIDKSFILEVNNKCAGICFLPLEKINDTVSISILGSYIFAPLADSSKNEKIIYDTINTISAKFNVGEVFFKLSSFRDNTYNYLLAYGFLDATNHTCVLTLSNSKETLWTNLRKRYKSLINSLIKNDDFSIEVSDDKNSLNLHQQYVTFHKQHMINAKKTPKNDLVYQTQFNLLTNNKATIIAVKNNNIIILVNYFFHDTLNVAYASSAYDTNPIYQKLPLNHYLLWNAILYFKSKKLNTMMFGQPCNFNAIDGFNNYASDKEQSISHFKKGMGVSVIEHMQGVKFFDKILLIDKINQFKEEVENEL